MVFQFRRVLLAVHGFWLDGLALVELALISGIDSQRRVRCHLGRLLVERAASRVIIGLVLVVLCF